MPELAACVLESLDASRCRDLLAWVVGNREAPTTDGVELLLAYCYDGVTWGRLDRDTGRWQLACVPFPDYAQKPREEKLLELRLFGPEFEILIWRQGRSFTGRTLRDHQCAQEYLRPIDESRILLADRLLEGPKGGFSRVGSPIGAEQVVPVDVSEDVFQKSPWPLRLHARHYLESDDETGAVRIAATRLVKLEVRQG
jgi:CRISPR-associated protein (TIGR03984 family)